MTKYISLGLRAIVIVILWQTLYFKFTAHPDSVYIFSQLGAEPIGRIGSGIVELITGVLLLFRRSILWGSLLGSITMLGAIASHLFVIGIEVNHDGGTLFAMAILVFCSCISLIIMYKDDCKKLLRKNS